MFMFTSIFISCTTKGRALRSSISYIWIFKNSLLLNNGIDYQYINWFDRSFPEYDWTEFSGKISEDIPLNSVEPSGMPVQINVLVNANHAQNKVTHHSHTGILMYLNKAQISWFSKA
jgi:hypothetical protein